MITIISHIFNEEYLLPFWLEHHSKIFDHGIIIDYCSTDKSIEIIKEMCPSWKIITTKNKNSDGTPNFEAKLVDNEVNEIEKMVEGYKITLNTSEFLMINSSKEEFINSLSQNRYYNIKSHSIMTSKNINNPKNLKEFFSDIDLISSVPERGHRTLHSDPFLLYDLGRHMHFSGNNKTNIYSTDIFILWAGYYPNNNKMTKRKLQIQQNIPEKDKTLENVRYHIIDFNQLVEKYISEFEKKLNIDEYDKYIFDTIKNITHN